MRVKHFYSYFCLLIFCINSYGISKAGNQVFNWDMVDINSESLKIDRKEGVIFFSGGVVLKFRDMVLQAPEMKVEYSPSVNFKLEKSKNFSDFKKVKIYGPVIFYKGDNFRESQYDKGFSLSVLKLNEILKKFPYGICDYIKDFKKCKAVIDKNETLKADYGEYDIPNSILKFSGNVMVKNESNSISCKDFIYMVNSVN